MLKIGCREDLKFDIFLDELVDKTCSSSDEMIKNLKKCPDYKEYNQVDFFNVISTEFEEKPSRYKGYLTIEKKEFGYFKEARLENIRYFEKRKVSLVLEGEEKENTPINNMLEGNYNRSYFNVCKLVDMINPKARVKLTLVPVLFSDVDLTYTISQRIGDVSPSIGVEKGWRHSKDISYKAFKEELGKGKVSESLLKKINKFFDSSSITDSFRDSLYAYKRKDFDMYLKMIKEEFPEIKEEMSINIMNLFINDFLNGNSKKEYETKKKELSGIEREFLVQMINIETRNKEEFEFYNINFFNRFPVSLFNKTLIISLLNNRLDAYVEYVSNIENSNGIERGEANFHLYSYIINKFTFYLYEQKVFNEHPKEILNHIENFCNSKDNELFPRKLKTESFLIKQKLSQCRISDSIY